MTRSDGREIYRVVWPRGAGTVRASDVAPRLSTLEGKTIGQLWDDLFRGDEIFPILEEELGERTVGFRINDEDLEDLKTVGDAVDYVVARLAQAS